MTKIVGAILAGGKSSRFGEQNKALAQLGGQTLIEHVVGRISPQVSTIVFSGDAYDLPGSLPSSGVETSPQWVSDVERGQRGPLIAVLSCLKYLNKTGSEWLFTSACDTPFLPGDIVEKLMLAAEQKPSKIAVAHDDNRLQPANALWHRDSLNTLQMAVGAGVQGFHQFLDTQAYAIAEWPEGGNHFININTQVDLEKAEKLLLAKHSS